MSLAVHMAETELHAFFVRDPLTGVTIPLRVARGDDGVPFLRAYRRGQWTDELLDLPDCPAGPPSRLPKP